MTVAPWIDEVCQVSDFGIFVVVGSNVDKDGFAFQALVELHMNGRRHVVELIVAEVEDLDAFVVACLEETSVSLRHVIIGGVLSVSIEARPVLRLGL